MLLHRLKQISMLSLQVLAILRFLARVAKGRVLEIGPYVGGSTVALCTGAANANAERVISIEVGGRYEEHPHVPSRDI